MIQRNQDIFERIERYMQGEMTEQEKSAFEAEIATNPDLQREMEKHKELVDALKDQEILDFRRKIQTIEGKEKAQARSLRKRLMRFAAAIVLIIGLTAVIWYTFRADTKNLYENYFTAYPVESQIRGSEVEGISNALDLYKDGEYEEAIPGLEQMLMKEPENGLLKIYLGNSLMEFNEMRKAVGLFTEFNSEMAYYEEARWYLALAYLKMDQKESSKSVLKEIIEYDGIYKDKAESLLIELENQVPDDS